MGYIYCLVREVEGGGDVVEQEVCPISYYGSYSTLDYLAYTCVAASAGDYAIIAGAQNTLSTQGTNSEGNSYFRPPYRVYAFDSNLNYSLIGTTYGLRYSTSVTLQAPNTDYAMFCGGFSYGTSGTATYYSTVLYYTSELTSGTATSLSSARIRCSRANVGDYALIGPNSSSGYIDAFDTDLTRTSLSTTAGQGERLGSKGLFKPYGVFINSSTYELEAYDEQLVQCATLTVDVSADLESLDYTAGTYGITCDMASEDYIAIAHTTQGNSTYKCFMRFLNKDLVESTLLQIPNKNPSSSMTVTRNGYMLWILTTTTTSLCIDKDLLVSTPSVHSFEGEGAVTGTDTTNGVNYAVFAGGSGSYGRYVSVYEIPN